MSDPHDGEGRDTELDRVDALVSAAMDDELDAAARADLEAAIAGDPAVAARVRAFGRVDDALRELAADPISEAQHAEGYAQLRARLAEEENAGGAQPPGVLTSLADRRRPGLPVLAPIVLTAAAVAALFLIVSRGDRSDPTQGAAARPPAIAREMSEPSAGDSLRALEIDPGSGRDVDLESDFGLGEERVIALGYADEANGAGLVPGIALEDFEIIDQLEVLEYLAARESEGRG